MLGAPVVNLDFGVSLKLIINIVLINNKPIITWICINKYKSPITKIPIYIPVLGSTPLPLQWSKAWPPRSLGSGCTWTRTRCPDSGNWKI